MKNYRPYGRKNYTKKRRGSVGLTSLKRFRPTKWFYIIAAAAAAVVVILLFAFGVFGSALPDVSEGVSSLPVADAQDELPEEVLPDDVTVENMETVTSQPDFEAYASVVTLQYGSEGDEVASLQERLAKLGYLDKTNVTGTFDKQTRISVINFQKKHELQYDGIAGPETQAYVFWDDAVPYEFSFGDGAPTTYMTFNELVGDNGIEDMPEGFPSAGTYKLVADIERQTLIAYEQDSFGAYTLPVRYMLCSIGEDIPTGTMETGAYRVRFGSFDRDGKYRQYWTQISGSIYMHSILYDEKDASSYIEDSYVSLGSASAGDCITLTVPDARWIWYNIAPGTEIVVRYGASDDIATTEIRNQLVLAELPVSRPGLSAGSIPDTDNWCIENVPVVVEFTQGSQD